MAASGTQTSTRVQPLGGDLVLMAGAPEQPAEEAGGRRREPHNDGRRCRGHVCGCRRDADAKETKKWRDNIFATATFSEAQLPGVRFAYSSQVRCDTTAACRAAAAKGRRGAPRKRYEVAAARFELLALSTLIEVSCCEIDDAKNIPNRINRITGELRNSGK